MDKDKFLQIVWDADNIILRKGVIQWAQEHDEFREFMSKKLCPTILEVDFAEVLQASVSNNFLLDSNRMRGREYVDWRVVFYSLIHPWAKEAETLPSKQLQKLVEAIITEVAMTVTEDDFCGDEWDGDDFSSDLSDIIDAWADMAGLLLLRNDLEERHIQSLRKLIVKVLRHRVITSYIGSPFRQVIDLIDLRLKVGTFSEACYDMMTNEISRSRAGEWICRKIDYLQASGKADEAEKCMNEKFFYVPVSLKCINQFIAKGDWQTAIQLIDKANKIERRSLWEKTPDWLEMKYELLKKYAPEPAQLDALTQLFYQNWDEKYYHLLKEKVPANEWHAFYHKLLKADGCHISTIKAAPFLAEEKEWDRLYHAIKTYAHSYPSDYSLICKWAKPLQPTHGTQMAALIKNAFLSYASIRYAPKQKVDQHDYTLLCQSLSQLPSMGYPQLQTEIINHLLTQYRPRRLLIQQLKSLLP